MWPLTVLICFLGCYDAVYGFHEQLDTCPSENPDFAGVVGKRLRPNQCATVVPRLFLKTGDVDEARLYCNKHFKNGRLELGYVYINCTGKTLLTNGKSENAWNNFICVHDPYLNCKEDVISKCDYSVQQQMCILKSVHIPRQRLEVPFGRKCIVQFESSGNECSCTLCENTQWLEWKSYFVKGLILRTRYRPMDQYSYNNCMLNSSLCCYEHSITHLRWKNENTVNAICLNDGQLVRSDSAKDTCVCHPPFHGAFCELSVNYRNRSRVVAARRVLHAALEFLISLMFLFLLFTCFAAPIVIALKCIQSVGYGSDCSGSEVRGQRVLHSQKEERRSPFNDYQIGSVDPWLLKSTMVREIKEGRKTQGDNLGVGNYPN